MEFNFIYPGHITTTFDTVAIMKSLLNPLKPFPDFFSQMSSQKYCFGFLNFKFPIFNEFLNFTIAPYGETKNLNYLENE